MNILIGIITLLALNMQQLAWELHTHAQLYINYGLGHMTSGRRRACSVFHTLALFRITSTAVCLNQNVRAADESGNTDWMFNFESLHEN